MDELSEKLASLLNDPETMDRVRKMAENILGEEEEVPKSSPIGDSGSILGSDEIGTIISIISKMKMSGDDSRAQLLNALKPHLSRPKQEKVDTAIKILKLIDLLPLLKESGILKL